MKRNLALFIFLLISSFNFAQNSTLLIPGTKYSMNPPEGFILSPNFSGFQNNEIGASIMISDLPTSYFDLTKGFTKEVLKSKGMDLISKDNVKYGHADAMLYKVRQNANGINYLKQMLIFGDEKKTVIVNGIYPEKSKEYEKDIYNALFTIKYDEKQSSDLLEAADFSVDVSGTDYQLVKSLLGSLLYTEDGKLPSDKGLIIVSNSLGNKVSSDHKNYSIERLKKLPDADQSSIKTFGKIKIHNMDGYEITAEGNENQLIYQVMLYTPDNEYYLIVGFAKDHKEKSLEVFKKVAKTFKIK